MKTFLVVTLYTIMVVAVDLGGAAWAILHGAQPLKAAVASANVATSVKSERATQSAGAIHSDT